MVSALPLFRAEIVFIVYNLFCEIKIVKLNSVEL